MLTACEIQVEYYSRLALIAFVCSVY